MLRFTTIFPLLLSLAILPCLCTASTKECEADFKKLEDFVYPDASTMWSSWGLRPGDYGNYDQCRGTAHGEYCLITTVSQLGLGPGLTLGSCVPKSCSEDDLASLVNLTLTNIHTMDPNITVDAEEIAFSCVPRHRPALSTGASIMVAVFAVLGTLMLLGTLTDAYLLYIAPVVRHSTLKSFFCPPFTQDGVLSADHEYDQVSSKTVNPSEKSALLPLSSKVAASEAPTLNTVPTVPPITFQNGVGILRCWSAFLNMEKLMLPTPDPTLKSLNGVRVISMFAVVLGHTVMYYLAGNNMMQFFDFAINNWTFQMIIQAVYAVDTFFFLSGFLVGFLVLKEIFKREGRINWFLFYFHRFWRLTPTLALWLLFYWQLFPYMGEGPSWSISTQTVIIEPCNQGWWKTLLYIQNLFPMNSNSAQCMAWAWYLGNDMTFYVLTPILLFPFYKSKLLGWILLVLSIGGGLVANILTIHHWNLSEYVLSAESAMDPHLYMRPWTRCLPYLVGIGFAFILHQIGFKKRVGPFLAQLMLLTSFAIMGYLYFQPYDIDHNSVPESYGTWSKARNMVYITLSRLGWGIALALFFYVCTSGYGHVFNWFLGHEWWTPPARLTYSAYLVHFFIIQFYDMQSTQPLHWSIMTASFQFLATLVLAYAGAILSFLIIERPLMNLEKLILPGSGHTK